MQENTHGNIPFQAYLAHYELQPVDVAVQSGVRYVTVWNILKKKPVTAAHAAQVRRGLQKLTGVPYLGPIETLPP